MMKNIKGRFFAQILLTVFALSLSFSAHAQTAKIAADVKTEGYRELKLDSKLMKREMPYRVILPADYDAAANKKTYPVIYLLHGLTGHYSNWTDSTNLVKDAKNYNFIIVTPEGDNGWYSDSVSAPNDKYESYIIQELIPEIEKKFLAKNDRANRVIAGLSMGGYGAMKFGLKYPDKFSLIGSFSGALAVINVPAAAMKAFSSVEQVFGADDSESRKANDVIRLVKEMPTDKIKQLPFIYESCGTEDFLFQSNRDFSALLLEKRIPHEFRQLPGVHDWKFWNAQIAEFLELSAMKIDGK